MVTANDPRDLAARIVESSAAAIVVTDAGARIRFVNPAFTRITGYPPDEVLGRSPRLLQSGRHSPKFYQRMWRRLTHRRRWHGEIWDRRKNGEVFPMRMSVTAIDERGATLYVGVFEEIAAEKRREERLCRLAFYDPLTGLPNRTLLADRLERGLVQAKRSGRCLAVLFVDVDGFKHVNDRFGHAIGDRVLARVGRTLTLGLRRSDTVARVGGDEFVVLLPDLDSRRQAIPVARKILRSLSAGLTVGGRELAVGASIGISSYPDDARDARQLLRLADSAMYRLKRERRGARPRPRPSRGVLQSDG
ncbi:MAG TPA: diguanylate cyclase [Candidatus Polarisedimenticolaceae bacterium]|nr:diguanylate cyclase [Candidatus Polarisedimenticolaceae bacterium]